MWMFFQCVAEAAAEKGLRGVAELAPGGGAIFDIGKGAWEKYRQRCKEDKQREEIQQMAQASLEEIKKEAIAEAKKVAAEQPQIQAIIEVFLTQIPASIQQSLKRPDDPTGKSVPGNFSLRS